MFLLNPPSSPGGPGEPSSPWRGPGAQPWWRRTHSSRCCRPSSGPRWPPGGLPPAPSRGSEASSAMTDKTSSRVSCLPCPSAQRLHHRSHFQHLVLGRGVCVSHNGHKLRIVHPLFFLIPVFLGLTLGGVLVRGLLIRRVWSISRPLPGRGVGSGGEGKFFLFLALSVTVARAKNSRRTLPVISLALGGPLPK